MKRIVLAVMAAGMAATVVGQSLGEVAARDQERRAREGSPAPRSYTDADLGASPTPPPSPSPSPSPIAWQGAGPKPRGWKAPTPSPSPTAAAAPGRATPLPQPSPLSEVDRSAQESVALEARWREIAAQRREALVVAERRVAELESRVTGLRNDMSPVGLGDPNRQQTIEAQIGQAQNELVAARAAAVAARQNVDALEDDARKAGALPGWVR